MNTKKHALFDRLITEIDNETNIFTNATILQEDLVSYSDSRTGHQAYTTYHRYYAISSLSGALRKRFIGSRSSEIPTVSLVEREQAARSLFLTNNAACGDLNHIRFDTLPGFPGEVSKLIKEDLRSALSGYMSLHSVLATIAHCLRSGPGASSDASDTYAGSYGRLMSGSISFSSVEARDLYIYCASLTPLSHAAEAVRQKLQGVEDSVCSVAKFCSVPKTNEKNRGICTQPSGNMALQLGLHELFSDVLTKQYRINIETQQPKNQALACLGSRGQIALTNRSWNFCTEDQTSASDFISCGLITHLLPSVFTSVIDIIRSEYIEVDDTLIRKHMISTMGNGFTFSLMTLLFCSIVRSLYKLAHLPEYDFDPVTGNRIQTWAVYGDDVIIDRSVLPAFRSVCKAFGFHINELKSYSSGLFRESCGGDYVNGRPVRPVFVETLDTNEDIYSLLNRLIVFAATHTVDLSRSCQVLIGACEGDIPRIPNWEDVSSGLHVPYCYSYQVRDSALPSHIRNVVEASRTSNVINPIGENPRIIKNALVPYKLRVPKPLFVQLMYEKSRDVLFSWWGEPAYRKVCKYTLITSQQGDAPINLPGYILCMLNGSIRDGKIGVRPLGPPRYVDTWRICPGWGDPSVFRSTAVHARVGTAQCFYKVWEHYVAKLAFCQKSLLSDSVQPRIKSAEFRADALASMTFVGLTAIWQKHFEYAMDRTNPAEYLVTRFMNDSGDIFVFPSNPYKRVSASDRKFFMERRT